MLNNDDPYYLCGIQFKLNSDDNNTYGMRTRVCLLETIRSINVTYDLDKIEDIDSFTDPFNSSVT